MLVAVAFMLFLNGEYGWGLIAAWLMTFLDTVDGKLARTTLTSSKWGDIFDHGIDLVHPPFWYAAWAMGLATQGFAWPAAFQWSVVAVILGGYVMQRLIEGIAIKWLGMEIHIWRPIDTYFREITARRNPEPRPPHHLRRRRPAGRRPDRGRGVDQHQPRAPHLPALPCVRRQEPIRAHHFLDERAAAAMTVGLIVNPRSGRRTGKGERLMSLLKDRVRFPMAMLDDFGGLRKTLADFAARGVDVLTISSGDGTIQAIQTELAERNPFAKMPTLMLLPHGTANMTAADLGMRTHRPAAVAALLSDEARLKALPRRQRPTLRVVNPADGRIRHGMFVGAGAVYTGTRFCQQAIHATGIKGNPAIAATLAVCIGGAIFNRRATTEEERIARPYHMRMASEGREKAAGGYLLTLATTLNRLVLGTRPSGAARRARSGPPPCPSRSPTWRAGCGRRSTGRKTATCRRERSASA